MLRAILIFVCIGTFCFAKQSLEVVSDNELIELVRTERFVVVLFSKYG